MAKGLGSISWQELLSAFREEAMVVGPDYAILSTNQPLLERLGLPASQVLGQPCYQMIHGKSSPCYESGEECPVRQVLETGRPATAVHRRTAEGYRRYVEVEAHPLRDARGKLAAVLVLSRELGLGERYQRLFNAMREGVALLSRSGRFVDVNPALCRMLGYTREELARLTMSDLVAPEIAAAWRGPPQDSPYMELSLPRKDGSLLPVEAAVSTLPLGSVTLYVAFVRDISRRKQWEETLVQQAQALAQSEAQYRALFESAGDALAVIEADGTISLVNPRFEDFSGYTKEEIEGRMSVPDLVLEEDLGEVMKVRQRRLAGESITQHQNRIRCKDGVVKNALVTGVLIPGTQRSFVSFVDITEAQRLQEEVLSRNRELEALHVVSELVSRSTDVDDMLKQVLDKVLGLTGQSGGIILLLDEEQGKLFIRAYRKSSQRLRRGVDGIALGEGFAGRVAQTGQALFVSDVTGDPRLTRKVVTEEGIKSVATIPLFSGGKVLGVASITGGEARDFSPEERRLLVSIGNEIGMAVERAQLLQEAQERARELEALYSVASLVSRSPDVDPMLERVLEKVLELTGQSSGLLFLLDERQGKLFIRAHNPPSESLAKGVDGLELGEGFAGRVAQTGEPLFIPDVRKDARLSRPVVLEEGIRSLACVPLVSGGRVLGAMNLGGKEVREFSQGERRLLVSLGNEIGVAVERAQLLQRARDRAQEMESLMAVTREMASTLELEAVLDRTLAIMCRQVGAGNGFLCLLDQEKGELTAKAFWGERASATGRVWKMGEGVAGWVAQHQGPMVSDDIAMDPRLKGSQAPSRGFLSAAAVPLKAKDKLLGVVVVASRERAAFTGAHLRLLSAYAAEASMALENALLHQEVRRQASTDDLTRLANRRHLYLRLEEELKRAQRYGHPLSLLFLDVNDLKVINDQYGHLQGDELLRHLAALLGRVLRGTDVAARYGGDEFVVLLPETNREEAAGVVERLLREATPCPLPSGGSIPWGMTVGVAWTPLEGKYDVDLLRLADEAAYRAKREGVGWAFANVG